MRKYFLLFFSFILLLSCKSTQIIKSVSQPTIEVKAKAETETALMVGQTKISPEEVEVYLTGYAISDSVNSDSILNDLVAQKRYYLDALSKGYSTNTAQNEELSTYKRILAKNFIIDSSLVNTLARTTYGRLKKEIHAAHILLALPPDAAPQDTMVVYDKIMYLRNEALKGASFDSLARLYSADINTKATGGDMGWFSALQLLFPLENAAYETPVGGISQPVRTEAGYQILKVLESRPFSGKLQVQHILKAVPQGASSSIQQYQKAAIDSLYQVLIKKQNTFDALCKVSSDHLISRENGGLLPAFSIGSWADQNFEQAAFALKVGEISKPIKTSVGWHIIKLVSKQTLEPYHLLEEMIINKVKTDSRGEYLEEAGFAKYADKLNIYINQKALNQVYGLANNKILTRNWKPDKTTLKNEPLLKLADQVFSNYDFIDYAKDKQTFEKQIPEYRPEMYLRRYFKDFKTSKVQEAVVANLESWNPDFKHFIQAYSEGLLVSNYLNDELYEKSVSDTTGQRLFYEQHLDRYSWPRKARATILKTTNDSLFQEYHDIVASGKPYRLKRGILPFYYQKNRFELDDDLKRKLTGLIQVMDKNPGYLVEIGGHRDLNENTDVSSKRIQAIVKYLIKNGLEITKITEYDYGSNKLADLFDWPQNQRVSFQFFSINRNDIAKILNNEKDSFEMGYGNYFEGENELIDGTNWEVGDYETKFDNHFYRIELEEVIPAKTKTLKECRGEVINDYQKELERKLNQRLKEKYPLKIEKSTFNKLYQQYRAQNTN